MSSITLWPSTPKVLRELLGVDSDPCNKCHATTKKHARCRNPVSRASAVEASSLLGQIVSKGSLDAAARLLLERLSRLVLCKGVHQKYACEKLGSWEKKLEVVQQDVKVKVEDKKTDESCLTTIAIDRASVSTGKPQIKEEEEDEIMCQSPTTSSRKQQQKPYPPPSSSSLQIPSNLQVKSSSSTHKQPRHHFEAYEASKKCTASLNKDIKQILLQALPPQSGQHHSQDGYIYVYTFPETYRAEAPLLKVGFTQNMDSRMASWERQCGYTPKVLSQHLVDLHVRVEKLAHAHLHNFRKREVGRPDAPGCPGCGKKHKEWFDVRNSRVAEVVGLWADWTRRVPYDADGNLKESWRQRLDDVDLSNSRCWQAFVNGNDVDEEE